MHQRTIKIQCCKLKETHTQLAHRKLNYAPSKPKSSLVYTAIHRIYKSTY